jgi:hypothetical protein
MQFGGGRSRKEASLTVTHSSNTKMSILIIFAQILNELLALNDNSGLLLIKNNEICTLISIKTRQ